MEQVDLKPNNNVFIILSSRNSVASIMTRLRDGLCVARGGQTSSWSGGTAVLFSEGKAARAWKLTTHLYLVQTLRTSGPVPHLHLHAFMAWTGATLPSVITANFKDTVDLP